MDHKLYINHGPSPQLTSAIETSLSHRRFVTQNSIDNQQGLKLQKVMYLWQKSIVEMDHGLCKVFFLPFFIGK